MKNSDNRPASSPTIHVESGSGNFELEIRIRGRVDSLHRETCEGLEDAIRIGEKWFRAFQARNPWFVQDSRGKRIFILLDPDTGNMLRS
jgi:hypothetical protein